MRTINLLFILLLLSLSGCENNQRQSEYNKQTELNRKQAIVNLQEAGYSNILRGAPSALGFYCIFADKNGATYRILFDGSYNVHEIEPITKK